MEINQAIKQYKIIPLAQVVDDSVLPTIGAICSGGLPLVCIPVNGNLSKKALTLAVNTFTDTYIGARALDHGQAELACSCAVRFLITPFFSEKIHALCISSGVKYIPGCLTPGEIYSVSELGLDIIAISPSYLISDPAALGKYASEYPQIKFIADCSCEQERAGEFAAVSKLFGCLDPGIASGSLDEIADKCRDAVRKYSDNSRFY